MARRTQQDADNAEAGPSSQPADSASPSSQQPAQKRARRNPSEPREPSAKTQRDIERAIAKFRGWPARDIVINNEGYGAVLQALKKEYNLEYREGRFSDDEIEIILKHVDIFRKRNRMSDAELRRVLFGPHIKENKAVMAEMVLEATTALNGTRPYPAVREFLQRRLREGARQGFWTDEEVVQLRAAVEKHGHTWAKIAKEVGRTGEDCRKKFAILTEAEAERDMEREVGPWTAEELQALSDTVEKVKGDMGIEDVLDGRVRHVPFWKTVHAEAGINRLESQLRSKYRTMAIQQNKVSGRKPRNKGKKWSLPDRIILLDRIIAQLKGPYSQESDIVWAKLRDPEWDWAVRDLMMRWAYIKNRYGRMKHPGSFPARCQAMRRLVLEHKVRWQRKQEKKKRSAKTPRPATQQDHGATSSAQTADRTADGAESSQGRKKKKNKKDKGKEKVKDPAKGTSQSGSTLGKRRRTESDSDGESSMSSEDEEEPGSYAAMAALRKQRQDGQRAAPSGSTPTAQAAKRATARSSGDGAGTPKPSAEIDSDEEAAAGRSQSSGSSSSSDSSSDSDSDEDSSEDESEAPAKGRAGTAAAASKARAKATQKSPADPKAPAGASPKKTKAAAKAAQAADSDDSSDTSSDSDDDNADKGRAAARSQSSSDSSSSSSDHDDEDTSSSSDDDDEDSSSSDSDEDEDEDSDVEDEERTFSGAQPVPNDMIDSEEEDELA